MISSASKALVVERTKQIVDLHLGIEASLRRSVQDAIRLGELLTAQKEALSHGEFLPWIERELPFSQPTASRYMMLFAYKNKVFSLNSLTEAYQVAQIEDQRQHPKPRPQVAPEVRERQEAFKAHVEKLDSEARKTQAEAATEKIDVDDLLNRAHETIDAVRRGTDDVTGGQSADALLIDCQVHIEARLIPAGDLVRHSVVNGLIKWLREMSINLNRKAGAA